MGTRQDLRSCLRGIDRSGYGAYKRTKGRWGFSNFELFIDHVQGDPFAAPSRLRIRVPQTVADFPKSLWRNRPRRIALEDAITRRLAAELARSTKGKRGSGHSGRFSVVDFGQCILPRTSVSINEKHVEAVVSCGLPAAGRRVLGRQAEQMLLTELPTVVERALIYANLDQQSLGVHVECGEDATALREQLQENNLVAFVAAGAILPRRSGVSDLPRHENVIPFVPPPSLTITLNRPNAGPIRGMRIPAGVTLIVGGGYHGKSTLLSALAQGVYNHIPGDGRECVVTTDAAVLIRSEDGRFVAKTDLSPFIRGLPDGTDTRCFLSDNASGSTSQAANIAEALEVRATLLLVDEDTSATNFMIRDQRMQELVVKAKEPITPFIDRVRQLYEKYGVSTILVMGGSGDYFEVADTVIMMDAYRPHEVTARAKEIANRLEQTRTRNEKTQLGTIRPRRPDLSSIRPRTRKGRIKIRASNNSLRLGKSTIDLSRIHQIAEPGQVRAIAYLLVYLAEHRQGLPPDGTIAELTSFLKKRIEHEDMWWFLPFRYGDITAPRRFELAAALNRLRTLRIIG